MAAYIAYIAYNQGTKWAVWVFGIVAVVFNPIAPIHMERGAWAGVDAVTGIIFFSWALISGRRAA